MKKLFAILLAVAMLLSLGVTAFAAPTTGKLQILDPPADSTYTAHKIFIAHVDDPDVTYYADPTVWGVPEADDMDTSGKLFIIAKDGSNKATTVDDPALYGLKFVYVDSGDYAGKYKVEKSTGYDAAKFAAYVSESGSLPAGTDVPAAADYAVDLEPGYYLVKCTGPESLALTTVLPGATVKVQNKKDMPLEKTVDTPEAEGEDNNNTGVSVGDVLNYKIESKVPSISDKAETYTFVISDTMSEGLTFLNELTVTIGTEVHVLTYDPETGTFSDAASGTAAPAPDATDPATAAARITELRSEIATLDTQISTAQGNVDTAQGNVDTAQGNVNTAQSTLSNAQSKLAALEAAVINPPATFPADIGGESYNTLADVVTALGTNDATNPTGQYLVVKNAQTALTDAQTALTDAQTALTDAQAALTTLTEQKAAKEAEIAALQAAVNPEAPAATVSFTLVDNATDLLNGDQVRFGWNGKTFELSINMMSRKALAGETVTIEYQARVNEDAVAEILQNTAVLAFGEDNDIDYRDAETDNYTSQLIIDKFETGNRSQKLAGAEFILKATDGENDGKYYQLTGKRVVLDADSPDGLDHKVGDGADTNVNSPLVYENDVEVINPIYFQADKDGKLQVAMLDKTTPTDENGNPVFANANNGGAFYGDIKVEWVDSEADASVVKTDAEGRGVFGYLPDGTFDLIETEAPINYIQLTDPIEIVIDGHRAVDKSLSMNERINALTNAANVENTPGQSLPSTGGVGATLLTIGGVALMLAAGAFLILRRKEQE